MRFEFDMARPVDEYERGAINTIVQQILAARMEPMESACRLVMQLGYGPTDCVIEHHRPDFHSIDGYVERDRLVVNGVPAFEVVTTFADLKYTTNCRVLTWPPLRAPEPAPTSVGGDET